jgi:hypothetical protein
MGSRECSVSMATGYGLDGQVSIPSSGRDFFFSTASRPALGPIQTPSQSVSGAFSPGMKRPGREVDNSPPSSIEVKKDGAIRPLPRTI